MAANHCPTTATSTTGDMKDELLMECPHDSLSGDEGPIEQLGRMPNRWRCDQCDVVVMADSKAPRQAIIEGSGYRIPMQRLGQLAD